MRNWETASASQSDKFESSGADFARHQKNARNSRPVATTGDLPFGPEASDRVSPEVTLQEFSEDLGAAEPAPSSQIIKVVPLQELDESEPY